MSATLNQLQLEAVALLASGKSPQTVRDQLALSTSTFEAWRQLDTFTTEVARQTELIAAQTATERQQTADTRSQDALETELDRMAQ